MKKPKRVVSTRKRVTDKAALDGVSDALGVEGEVPTVPFPELSNVLLSSLSNQAAALAILNGTEEVDRALYIALVYALATHAHRMGRPEQVVADINELVALLSAPPLGLDAEPSPSSDEVATSAPV